MNQKVKLPEIPGIICISAGNDAIATSSGITSLTHFKDPNFYLL